MEYKSNCIKPKGLIGVQIGSQIWSPTNLDIDDGEGGIYSRELHDVNGVDMGTQYYYTWDAAMRIASNIPGWHLPSQEEWNTLITYCGGTNVAGIKLKSTSGWHSYNGGGNGTDDYGFTVLPAGLKYYGNSDFYDEGYNAYFWSSKEGLGKTNGYYMYIAHSGPGASTNHNQRKTNGFSVRLVKD